MLGGIYLPDLRFAALGRRIGDEDLALAGRARRFGALIDLDLEVRRGPLVTTANRSGKIDEAPERTLDLRARPPAARVMRAAPRRIREASRAHDVLTPLRW